MLIVRPRFFRPGPLFFSACALIASASSVRADYLESFDSFVVGESLYRAGGPWRKYGSRELPQPAGNTAIVREEAGRRFLSLRAVGHIQLNSRAFAPINLPVEKDRNHRIAASIRYFSPGSSQVRNSNVTIALNATRGGVFDPSGTLNTGIISIDDQLCFFFDFGLGNRIVSRPENIEVKRDAWYRFVVDFSLYTGATTFTVHEQSAAGQRLVWSGDNAGLPPFYPETFFQINLLVARPGSSPDLSRSADFADIALEP